MVKFETWEAFEEAARDVYVANPLKARCTVKHRASDGTVVIAVTDDQMKARYQSLQEKDALKMQKFACNFAGWSASDPKLVGTKEQLAELDRKLEEELGGISKQEEAVPEDDAAGGGVAAGAAAGGAKAAGRGGSSRGRGKRRR